MDHLDKLKKEYDDLKPSLIKFTTAISEQFEEIIENQEIEIGFPLQTRIKEFDSIKNKIEAKRYNVKKSIVELQDLIGVRIILLSLTDITTIERIIRSDFKVLKSYNPAEKLNHDQFGYNSIHYILEIPNEWRNVPTFKKLPNFQFELQIRTLSQHIWAETSHSFNYKTVENVPRFLLRSIGRISALLETIDFEIDKLITQRKEYRLAINDSIISPDTFADSELNIDLLQKILEEKLGKRRMTNQNLDIVLSELINNKIQTSKQLIGLIEKHGSTLLKKESEYAKKVDLKDIEIEKGGYIFDYLGAVRFALRQEFSNYKPYKK